MGLNRECGDCTMCCQGHLYTNVNNIPIYPGNPCPYVSHHCTIYEDRPDYPCKQFQCQWLINPDFPEWMKPNQINVLAWKTKDFSNHVYLEVNECAQPIPSNALAWLYEYTQKTNLPMRVQVHGAFHYYGNQDFKQQFNVNPQQPPKNIFKS